MSKHFDRVVRAIGRNDLQSLRGLVAARPEALEEADAQGFTPLMLAVMGQDLSCFRFLLARSNPNAKRPDGQTALSRAISLRSQEAVELLIPVSDLSATTNGGLTCLMAAANSGWEAGIELLLPVSDPNALRASDASPARGRGVNALMMAVCRGGDNASFWALAKATNLSAKDMFGRTALMHAALAGRRECVEILASLSDLSLRSDAGLSAYSFAAAHDHWAVADLLVMGADPAELVVPDGKIVDEIMPTLRAWREKQSLGGLVLGVQEEKGFTTPADAFPKRSIRL